VSRHVRIRLATPGDVPAIADLCTRATREAYAGLVSEAYLARVVAHWYGHDRLLSEIAPAPGWFGFMVAERDGVVTGVAGTGAGSRDDSCELFTLYVDPVRQRRGVGRVLVAHAIGLARGADASELEVAVMPGNEAAMAFYEACGFRPAGERRIYAPHGEEGGPPVALVYVRRVDLDDVLSEPGRAGCC
jgi:ribosomal protein S18 acetylase RimI-like enzyme